MADAQSRVSVIIKGVDKVTQPLRQAAKTVGFFSRKARKSLDSTNKSARGLVGAVGLLAGAAALGKAVSALKDMATAGDEIAKTAGKLGIASDALQELRYAAERSGMSVQEFDKALEFQQRGAAEAAQGTGTAKDAYKALGISVLDAKGKLKDSQALMGEVADRLSNIKSASLRSAIAIRIYGRSGSGMINMLKDGSKGLAQLRKDFRDTGASMSKAQLGQSEAFADNWLNLTLVGKGVANLLTERVLPSVNKIMVATFEWWKANRKLIGEKLDKFLAAAASLGKGLAKALGDIWDAATALASAISSLLPDLGGLSDGMSDLSGAGEFLGYILGGALVIGLLAATKAMVAFTASLLLNPITWVVLGIAALVAAGVALYKNWDRIAKWWDETWANITDNVERAKDDIVQTLAALGAWWDGFWSEWGEVVLAGLAVITGPIGWLIGAGSLLINNWDEVKAWFSNLWDEVTAAWDEGGFFAAAGKLIEGLFKGFRAGMDRLGAWLSEKITTLVDGLGLRPFIDAGLNFVTGLWKGVEQGWADFKIWFLDKLLGLIPDRMRSWFNLDKASLAQDAAGKANAARPGPAQAPQFIPVSRPGQLAPAGGGSVNGRILVEFDNAPAGMRVRDLNMDGDTYIDLETGQTLGGL